MRFHPNSIELRYTLGLASTQLGMRRPETVHLAGASTELALAAVRAMGQVDCGLRELRVDSLEVQEALGETFGLAPSLEEDCPLPADFGLYPFTTVAEAARARETAIAVACENSVSYKSLIYPGSVPASAFRYFSALRPKYSLSAAASLYTPKFIALWWLAKVAQRLDSSLYFRWEDYAMRRLVGYGPVWRFSYLVVIVGRRRD
jgi:hypothetical protein